MLIERQKKYHYVYQESTGFQVPQIANVRYAEHIQRATLLNYYRKYIEIQERLASVGKLRKGTLRTYETRMSAITQFIIVTHGNWVYPKDFNIEVVREFELFLITRLKYSNDYAMKNIQLLSRVLTLAYEAGEVQLNPVKEFYKYNYERKFNSTFLTIAELKIISEKKLKQARLEKVKHIFLFMCYSGLSYVDVMGFRYSKDLILAPEGKKYIFIKRKKNSEKHEEDTFVPLLPVAEEILKIYGGDQLPTISLNKINSYIKEICDILGIEKAITTRVARKTFAVLLHNEYNVSIESIARMLGHSSIRTTQQYYVKTHKQRIIKDMEKSELFFSSKEDLVKKSA